MCHGHAKMAVSWNLVCKHELATKASKAKYCEEPVWLHIYTATTTLETLECFSYCKLTIKNFWKVWRIFMMIPCHGLAIHGIRTKNQHPRHPSFFNAQHWSGHPGTWIHRHGTPGQSWSLPSWLEPDSLLW